MAENAANFTSTFQNRPSIFEVIAQKSLNDTVYPALQKVALVLATNLPQKFSWLNNYFDETFLVLNGCLQYYYLSYHDASFAENFYGLKRVTNDGTLTKKNREISLIFLIIIPYLKRKLEEKIALIRIEEAECNLSNSLEGRLKKSLLYSYSTLELVWGLLSIQNYVRYMAKSTEYPTPIFKLINMQLAYNTELLDEPGFWTALSKGDLSWSQLSFGLIRNAVATSLQVGAFFLQFLQTWNAQKSNHNMTDLPNIKSPLIDTKSVAYREKCPLCLKPWIIPTVLQVSGYIFCFRCILRFLNENQRCPVTNLPAKPLDIVRLYIG
ncbi:unnamed protein product [Phaedon cochleariae]|uniref:Peroxisome assembly protein 12 n=1 Tax=Phaedon cochleariae TaxID=80249 RepID=A0A9N9SIU4_PHACE|nr:unnamed protein product [Phaedon cochleariae]